MLQTCIRAALLQRSQTIKQSLMSSYFSEVLGREVLGGFHLVRLVLYCARCDELGIVHYHEHTRLYVII